jgi:hypothetical protein
VWQAVSSDLEVRLTDDVLRDATRALPREYGDQMGDELYRALRSRRDRIGEVARLFYELLAGWVDITATDQDEVAELAWLTPRRLQVTIGPAGGPHRFSRTFEAGETREVRLYLQGGDDRAEVSGAGSGIAVRIIGGGGADQLVDATSSVGDVHFYDAGDATRFVTQQGTGVDTSEWDTPLDLSSNTQQSAARDWGSRWIPIPNVGFDPDVGLFLGGGAQYTGYGFRHFPYRSRFSLDGAVSVPTAKVRAAGEWDFPLKRELLRGNLRAAYEGAQVPHFHGFGNDTDADRAAEFYEAPRKSLAVGAEVRLLPRRGASVRVGPSLLVVRPDPAAGTLIDSLRPYGHSDFERIALQGSLSWQGQDDPTRPRLGGGLELAGYLAPAWLDVSERYWGMSFEASARASLGGPLRPGVALRAGGERVAGGRYPIFDAPTLGGTETLRGYRARRFTGDASLYGGAEARFFLTEFQLLFPGDLGVLTLAEAGRVFLDGESSRAWHAAWGAGLWASFIDAFGLSLTWARGSEGTAFYLSAGAPF